MNNSKVIPKNTLNNTLLEYYNSLDDGARQVFRFNVAMKLGVVETTLYRWLRGETTPRKIEVEALAGIVGIPAAQLYPCYYILDNLKNQELWTQQL